MPLIRIACVALLLVTASSGAGAHSWYDAQCCSDKDCSPALGADVDPDGSMSIEIAPSNFIQIPAGFPKRPSRDFDFHVCILSGRVLCVYVPGNS
jgi:hypothetical protein